MEEDRPPPQRVKPAIKAAPRIRQIYLCDFWREAIYPEFWKTRPVLIVSKRATLDGHALALPISASPQDSRMPWIHPLRFDWSPAQARQRWVICDHIYTVSTARLQPVGRFGVPRLEAGEFSEIVGRMLACLPEQSTAL